MNELIPAQENHPDEPAPALDALLFDEQFRLTRDGLVNTTAYLLASIAGMVLVPVLFAGLTREIYGIWIAALAIQYSTAFLGGGLGRGIAREVAMTGSERESDFVVIATYAYFLLGTLGALVIGSAGLLLASGLKVSAQNLSTAHAIFICIGIGFAGDQLQSLGLEILTGLRRFVTINIITTIFVLIRTLGIILVLRLGGTVITLAALHAILCLAGGCTVYLASIGLAPRFRPRLVALNWKSVRNQFHFSIASQLTAGATSVLWRSAPFLLGFIKGTAAIVPYELGGKFPMSVSSISWQAADVLFPAASEYHGQQELSKTRQLLVVGTRGVLLFALPLCLALFVLAPTLLATWIKGSSTDAVRVLQLMSLAVLLDSAATGSIQVVWGYGKIRSALQITLLSAAIGVVTAASLVPMFTAIGAAAGITIGVAFSSILFIYSASRTSQLRPIQVLASAIRSLFLPAIVELVFLLSCVSMIHRAGWSFLILCASVALMLYAAAFYAWSASPVEKKIVAGAFVSSSRGLYSFYGNLRILLERFPPFRIAIRYAVEMKDTLVDSSERDRKAVERLYTSKEDPFGFNRELERFRFQRASAYVQRAANHSRFVHALEIGCAEGMFTRTLAPWCESLLAVDLSPIAISRARRNCADLTNVKFAEWDVRKDSLDDKFDLIVATGVLEYIFRPSTLRSAKERITTALRPGGYLLLGNTENVHRLESTWIGKKLIRGTLVNDLFANDPRYELIDSSLDQCVCPFAHVLLRRRS